VIFPMAAAVLLVASHGAAVVRFDPPQEEPAPVQTRLERAWQNYREVAAGTLRLSQLTRWEVRDLIELDTRIRGQYPDRRTSRQRCIDRELDRLGDEPTRLALRTIDLKCSRG